MQKKLYLIVLISMCWMISPKAATPSKPNQRLVMLDAMQEESLRSIKKLKRPGFDPPYFISYEMKDNQSHHIRTRYGAVYKSSQDRPRRMRVMVSRSCFSER